MYDDSILPATDRKQQYLALVGRWVDYRDNRLNLKARNLKPTVSALSAAILIVGVGIGCSALAASPELPQLDSIAYCQNLTSKMLDKAERDRETAKCLSFEGTSKQHLQNNWHLVSPAGFKECTKPSNTLTNKSYIYLEGCIAHGLGFQCLRGDLRCEPKS